MNKIQKNKKLFKSRREKLQ